MSGNIVGNRYELLEKIGSGGMAIVYKARCRLLNRYVAIKMLRAEFNEDAEFLKRFETEAQAAASLSHPNIVSVYDVGTHNRLHYIVMEYVEGVTLKEYLQKNGPLSAQKIVDFGMQIASALEHAHMKKIIHHDIKPHNIIITEQGMLKVTDFGLARAVSASTVIASVGAIGSVHYASPEQSRGGYTDERSDIYSLGVSMYEMTAGRVPFDGDTPVSVAIKHLQKEPTHPSTIVPDVPLALENIILKAMEKDPIKRYQTAAEFMAALQGVLNLSQEVVAEEEIEEVKGATKRMPTPEEIDREEKKMLQEEEEEKRAVVKRRELTPQEEKNKKKEDMVAIVAAIATIVVIISVLGVVMFNILGGKFSAAKITVPDFTEMTLEEAEKMADESFVVIKVKGNEYNKDVEENCIISQDPEEGEKIDKGGKVYVVISRGEESMILGDYVNRGVEEVESELDSLKINYKVQEVFDKDVEAGKVVKTDPKAKSKISDSTTVTIYVSKGEEKEVTIIPNLIGNSFENAKILLTNRGLEVGDVSYIESDKPSETVVQQSPVANESVEAGTKINLVLSKQKIVEQPPEEEIPPATGENETGQEQQQSDNKVPTATE